MLALLLVAAGGCASTLDLGTVGDTKVPTATIYYTSVRSGQRRFADYGSVNRSILAPKK